MINYSSLSPDLAARCVIVAAYMYYVLDQSERNDSEYDNLARFVADNWDKLEDDRKWALGSPEQIRSTGSHIKYAYAAVAAAYEQLRSRGINPSQPFPTEWQEEAGHGRYVTAGTATTIEVAPNAKV